MKEESLKMLGILILTCTNLKSLVVHTELKVIIPRSLKTPWLNASLKLRNGQTI